MSYEAAMRVWRGDADGGELRDFTVTVNEGEVVLDVLHRLQATQTPDLAVRWNCKAGKCGSCSAEINGRPRLLCLTRMGTFGEDEVITVTPLRAFPVIRDLVTDVGFNYEKAARVPPFSPRERDPDGNHRMQQVDVERSQEFRKCIECYLCQDVCHVVRDHEENKGAFAGPRYLMRLAELDMHPLDTVDRKAVVAGRVRARHVQHHQVLHRGLPGGHPHHRQRPHPDEGARRRPQVRAAHLAGEHHPPSPVTPERCHRDGAGSAVQAEADLQRDLERGDLAVLHLAADLGGLEPLDVADRGGDAGDAAADGLLDGVRRGADDLGDAVDVVAHETSR